MREEGGRERERENEYEASLFFISKDTVGMKHNDGIVGIIFTIFLSNFDQCFVLDGGGCVSVVPSTTK